MVTSKFYISNDFRYDRCHGGVTPQPGMMGINGGLNRPFSEVMVIYIYYVIYYI
jgi:hypothetical protein